MRFAVWVESLFRVCFKSLWSRLTDGCLQYYFSGSPSKIFTPSYYIKIPKSHFVRGCPIIVVIIFSSHLKRTCWPNGLKHETHDLEVVGLSPSQVKHVVPLDKVHLSHLFHLTQVQMGSCC